VSLQLWSAAPGYFDNFVGVNQIVLVQKCCQILKILQTLFLASVICFVVFGSCSVLAAAPIMAATIAPH
jgi:hypothetical protein